MHCGSRDLNCHHFNDQQRCTNHPQQKKSGGIAIPLELTPLFVAMGVACASATFFTYKKFAHDKSLRLSRNPAQSDDSLKKLLEEEKSE
jgi:hypothetical protein